MLSAEQSNETHRLHWAEHWSVRKIARHLHIGRRTIVKYLGRRRRLPLPVNARASWIPSSPPSPSSLSRILMSAPR
jgi:hypothetical protein